MNEKERKIAFAEVFATVGVIYQKPMTDEHLRAYWLVLQDVPIDELKKNAMAHIATQKWFPLPCELMNANEDADAIRAWDAATAAIHHHGMYRHVNFEDSTVNAVIRHLGGWPEFCAMEPTQESWLRKEFVKAYKGLAKSGVSREQAAVLPGLSEANEVRRSKGGIEYQGVVVRHIAAPKLIFQGKTTEKKKIEALVKSKN